MEKKMRKNSQSLFFQIILVYTFTALLSFFLCRLLVSQPLISTVSQPSFSPLQFIFFFMVASGILLYIFKKLPSERVAQIIFSIAMYAGMYTTFYTVLLSLLNPHTAFILSLFIPCILLYIRRSQKTIWIHNGIILLASSGIILTFARQFPPQSAAIIVGVLGFYDIIAVYGSKQMVMFAKHLFERHAFFGVILPKSFSEWRKPYTDTVLAQQSVVLGAGDLIVPLLFVYSHYLYIGTTAALILIFSLFIGVVAMHLLYTLPKTKRPIPALAPLAVAVFLGYGLLSLLSIV